MDIFIQNPFIILFLFFFCLSVVSLIQDRRRFRNGLYLLNTLIWFGIAIAYQYRNEPIGSFIAIVLVVFVLFLIFIIPTLLMVNGYIVVRKEGLSLSNLLSFFYAILIYAGEIFLFIPLTRFGNIETFGRDGILLLLGYFVFYTSFIFLAFLLYSITIKMMPNRVDYDYVIVLGCGLIQGERVSKLLSNRLDKAIKVYNHSMSSIKFILSGGQGPDEKISEAEAMKQYLLSRDIPEKDILLEDQSKNTMQNLANSKAIIDKRGGRKYTAIVTNDYHVLRAMIYAKKLNFPVSGYGAKTAAYYWPSAITREYIALIKNFLFYFLGGYFITAFFLFLLLRLFLF